LVAFLINIFALILILISFYYNKKRSNASLKKALMKGLGLTPQLISLVFIIGIVFSFLPPELIREYLGGEFNFVQVAAAALFGSLMMIPSLIALPLAGSLIDAGASYTPVAAFVTTLTMVGFATVPVEIKELGKKITIYRNVLAVIFAVIVSLLIGVLM